MRFKIPVGGGDALPDPVEIRPAVGRARGGIRRKLVGGGGLCSGWGLQGREQPDGHHGRDGASHGDGHLGSVAHLTTLHADEADDSGRNAMKVYTPFRPDGARPVR